MSYDTCSICLSDFESSDRCKLICNHSIHYDCLRQLLCYQEFINGCPVCRGDFVLDECSKNDIIRYHDNHICSDDCDIELKFVHNGALIKSKSTDVDTIEVIEVYIIFYMLSTFNFIMSLYYLYTIRMYISLYIKVANVIRFMDTSHFQRVSLISE